MTDLNPTSDGLLRAMARHSAETSADGRKRILEEHSAAYRWLMASFLAVNGGGLIFLKDAKLESPTWLLASAIAFYVGIVGAFAIAWLGQRAARAAVEPMTELEVFWTMVSQTGIFDEEQFRTLTSKTAAVVSKSKLAPKAGWVSLAAFTVGLILIAAGWKT